MCAVCFDVYDLNGDGYISREEMFQLLKGCMVTVSLRLFHFVDSDHLFTKCLFVVVVAAVVAVVVTEEVLHGHCKFLTVPLFGFTPSLHRVLCC